MEFKVNSKELEKVLAKVKLAVPPRTPMEALTNILMEVRDGVLYLSATDMEMSLKTRMDVQSDGDCRVAFPTKMIYDLTRNLGDSAVTFRVIDGKKLELATDKGLYSIGALTADEYVEIPDFPAQAEDGVSEVFFKGKDLREALQKTAFAISKDSMRPAMSGTLLEFEEEGTRLVATDGHKLANYLLRTNSSSERKQYIIPEKAGGVIREILDERDVRLRLSSTHLSFSVGDLEFVTRLIGQRYPDYRSVIPMENEFELRVKAGDLLPTLNRMLIFASDNSKRIRFNISESNLEVSAGDTELGQAKESLPASYSGQPIEIGFNAVFLSEICKCFSQEEEIIFRIQSPNKAVVLSSSEKSEVKDMLMLIMPLRLNN